jgi:hypothetical protein
MDTRTLIKNLLKEERQNEMFFQNLKKIDGILWRLNLLDKDIIDETISDGNGWVSAHLASAKNDLEEIYDFLSSYLD